MKRIKLSLKATVNRSCIITIGVGLFKDLPAHIARYCNGSSVFIITESNVKRLYGPRLLRALLVRKMDAWLIDFPAGEASKNASVVHELHTQLLEHGVRRDSLVIALGGGVVGDVAGYVAATVLRGIRYIQVPTTLLAQVDSSVGGKVGIDHPLGKNLIGAFHQPSAVFIDPQVLRTLPEREYRAGIAEVVKIAAALDASFFRFLENKTSQIKNRNMRTVSELITHAVRLKAAVVGKDAFETGFRKTLNLGHTIAHAVEGASNYTLRHGEAVAIGLATESRIACEMGLLRGQEYNRLLQLMKALKLRTSFPQLSSENRFRGALSLDKKSVDGSPKFVLLKGIGRTLVGVDVPSPFIEAILSQKK